MNLLSLISPQWALKREAARMRLESLQKRSEQTRRGGYDAASRGRRLSGWLGTDASPAGATPQILALLRERSRDLARNGSTWGGILEAIESEVIGAGIMAKIGNAPRVAEAWKAWAGTTECDADGRLTFYGIQRLAMRTIAESGEVLIRRRFRRADESLTVPFQIQVIEPDMLADMRLGLGETSGNIKSGIAFDRRGQRTAYHLYKEHPSEAGGRLSGTVRVPASEILHIYRVDRPGQLRGVPWSSRIVNEIRMYDDYRDAMLEAARVAACFSTFITQLEPTFGQPTLDESGNEIEPDERVEPGMIKKLLPGESVEFGLPPTRSDEGFARETLASIAHGAGLPYELVSKDLSKVNFTSGRMGRLDFAKTVRKWRSEMLFPHLCAGVFDWFVEAATVAGIPRAAQAQVRWTAPRAEMVDPAKETAALQNRIRSGLVTWAEAVREQGFDPDELLDEVEEYNAEFDRRGITFDSDPRKLSQAGQSQSEDTSDDETTTDDEEPEESGEDDAAEAAE